MKNKKIKERKLTPNQRLAKIRNIIDEVDIRCAAIDGPVSETLEEITSKEIELIYWLALGK